MRFAILLFVSASLFAQVNTASLTGLLKDPSDAAIPKVKVTATHRETGIQRTTESDSGGIYFFSLLNLGTYQVTAQPKGFKKTSVTVTLQTCQNARQNLLLPVS